jgi:hypothetical protein
MLDRATTFTPNVARGDALELLRSLSDSYSPLGFFDPQFRELLDRQKYGNEGTRQSTRARSRLEFDLDPCSPGPHHWVPAREIYTVADDGLRQPWPGRVFMNPPFGGRNGHVPWIKFLDHTNGIAIVRAYTSSGWFHVHVVPLPGRGR